MNTIDEFALTLITYIGCCMSIVCLVVSAVFFSVLDGLQCVRTSIHKNLCLTFAAAQLTFLIGVGQTSNKVRWMHCIHAWSNRLTVHHSSANLVALTLPSLADHMHNYCGLSSLLLPCRIWMDVCGRLPPLHISEKSICGWQQNPTAGLLHSCLFDSRRCCWDNIYHSTRWIRNKEAVGYAC